ncbi:MAG: hypothetical protein HOA06_10070 [Chloroflexi bacterium]|jgi:hypothetical protein|nr:hypothetical protein [Chloroflexota bacterium]MBT7538638.1 hypothetical protein [Gammaproteobacteria bacterium]
MNLTDEQVAWLQDDLQRSKQQATWMRDNPEKCTPIELGPAATFQFKSSMTDEIKMIESIMEDLNDTGRESKEDDQSVAG